MMEAVYSYEILIIFYQTIQYHISEYFSQNLKSHTVCRSILKRCVFPGSNNRHYATVHKFNLLHFISLMHILVIAKQNSGSPKRLSKSQKKSLNHGSMASLEVWYGFIKINIKYIICNICWLCSKKYPVSRPSLTYWEQKTQN